jgi:hypothetical protein
VLYQKRKKMRGNGKPCFDVVYVGMARKGIKGRLLEHLEKKKGLWTHCSIFEVHSNIRGDEIAELEGILRHLYRRDGAANKLATQKSFARMKRVDTIGLKKSTVN